MTSHSCSFSLYYAASLDLSLRFSIPLLLCSILFCGIHIGYCDREYNFRVSPDKEFPIE